MRGSEMSITDLMRLHWNRVEGMAEIIQKTGSGFMLMPTTPNLAPELDPLIDDTALFQKSNLKALRNTTLGNIFNLPGVAMPIGSGNPGANRLASLLVSTSAGRDDDLLTVARILENIIKTEVNDD
jgi:aspartyl-tRNA(Asn)/glutamyl-tRNA(Gln) amidotransferase subunit A